MWKLETDVSHLSMNKKEVKKKDDDVPVIKRNMMAWLSQDNFLWISSESQKIFVTTWSLIQQAHGSA